MPDPLEIAEPIPPGTPKAELLESSMSDVLVIGVSDDDILREALHDQPVALTQPVRVEALDFGLWRESSRSEPK